MVSVNGRLLHVAAVEPDPPEFSDVGIEQLGLVPNAIILAKYHGVCVSELAVGQKASGLVIPFGARHDVEKVGFALGIILYEPSVVLFSDALSPFFRPSE